MYSGVTGGENCASSSVRQQNLSYERDIGFLLESDNGLGCIFEILTGLNELLIIVQYLNKRQFFSPTETLEGSVRNEVKHCHSKVPLNNTSHCCPSLL